MEVLVNFGFFWWFCTVCSASGRELTSENNDT